MQSQLRTAVVTGATGAIGKAIAAGIAARSGYRVLLPCRDPERGAAAAAEIRRASGNPQVHPLPADLARRRSVYDLAAGIDGPVHLLVNNAAATPRRRQETPEGIEVQLATNVLGYFWTIRALAEHLRAAAPARVVNVASYWAGGLDLSDLELRRRPYDNDLAYRQSKQADRMLTVAFAERLRADRVWVNACHPGDVRSRLSADLGFGGHETPEQGAATPVWLATAPELEGRTGGWYEHRRESRCRFGADREAVEALFRACEGYDPP
jgi:NAD(P)-dependent dehydrogenase (short-subunit alcohol dehydrogenase family)